MDCVNKLAKTKSAKATIFLLLFAPVIIYSQITWKCAAKNAPIFPRDNFGCIVFDDKMWILNGIGDDYERNIWCSTDGIQWSKVLDSTPYTSSWGIPFVVFNNSIWALGGRNGC